jgi:hypothetical protein
LPSKIRFGKTPGDNPVFVVFPEMPAKQIPTIGRRIPYEKE